MEIEVNRVRISTGRSVASALINKNVVNSARDPYQLATVIRPNMAFDWCGSDYWKQLPHRIYLCQ